MKEFIVQGRDKDGNRVFYTGCAGEKFISRGRFDAFVFSGPTVASNKAMALNRMTQFHGVHFTVLISNDQKDES